MAYLQLGSNNPDFSFILKKNPASGMLIKPCRKGRLFAWYTNPSVFNIYFRDSDMETSYSNEDFEYMDVTRYNSPLFLVNAVHEFLNHMKKVNDKDIIGHENVLIINQMKCKLHNLDAFKSHFLGYEFKFEEVASHNFRIEIKTKNTIRELISLGQLFSIFNALMNNDYDLYITEEDLDKYMTCLQVIDTPYYLRHLFKCHFLRTEKSFKKYKAQLEISKKDKLELEFGDTSEQRINAVQKILDFKSPIVDIGCGEGSYVREFAPRLDKKGLEYYAIDTNPERIETVKRLCNKKGIENVITLSSIDDFICPENPVIIMAEMIEHMAKDEAAVLVKKVMQWPFRSLIITTPNKEFNSNYRLFGEDMRHEDHIFEMTRNEFKVWIEENIKKRCQEMNKEIKFFDIGDKVNSLQPTLAVIIGG